MVMEITQRRSPPRVRGLIWATFDGAVGQPRYDLGVPAPVEVIATLVGFGLVAVAGAALNRGAPMDFSGLFAMRGRSDWPRGVQEGDVPRFEVDHLDGFRPPGTDKDTSLLELDAAEPASGEITRLSWDVHRVALKR